MNKLIFFLSLTIMGTSIASAQEVKITGEFNSTEPAQKAYLSYRNGEDRINDSAEIKNGKFSFKEKIIEPSLASLSIRFAPKEGEKRARMDKMPIFLEAGNVQINAKDSLKFAVVKGSKAHKEYEAYNKLFKPFNEQQKTLQSRYAQFKKDKDEAGMKSTQDEFQAVSKDKNEKVVKPYIDTHPNSPIVPTILNQYLQSFGYIIDPATAEPLYNNLSATNKNTYSGKSLKARIETAKKTAVGAYAMNFTQNDTLGKPVSLSDFKGKYVLLDFWASWCVPCRAENPNVVKAFNEYKDKSFTVLSVSLDQPGKQQSWLNAIHKDNLTWTHVSDLKFWNNAVAKQYDINAIPVNFLIDPTGRIVAKNIRGEELQKTLARLIK